MCVCVYVCVRASVRTCGASVRVCACASVRECVCVRLPQYIMQYPVLDMVGE